MKTPFIFFWLFIGPFCRIPCQDQIITRQVFYGPQMLVKSDSLVDLLADDFNAEGNPDIIAISAGGKFNLYQNTGDSLKFENPVMIYESSGKGFNLLVYDMDGDLDQDVVVAKYVGSIYCLENVGNGKFKPVTLYRVPDDRNPELSGNPFGRGKVFPTTCISDINADGKNDLLLTSCPASLLVALSSSLITYHSQLIWLENLDGQFKFDCPQKLKTVRNYGAEAATTDINRDEYPDILCWSSKSNLMMRGQSKRIRIEIFLNRGGGNLEFDRELINKNIPEPRLLMAGDYNQDEKPDLAAVFYNRDQIPSLGVLTNENGEFKISDTIPLGSRKQELRFIKACSKDIDSNGIQDIVVLTSHALWIFYNPANLHDPEKFRKIETSALKNIELTDLDGDSDIDIVGVNGEGIVWFENRRD